MISTEINKEVSVKAPIKLIARLNSAVNKRLGLKKAYKVSLAMVTEKSIKKWNRLYRKKNRVTDVLSFEGDKGGGELGEILICNNKIKSQAKVQKHSFSKELAILYVHGLLHLLGYDHEKVKDAVVMEKLEQEVLEG
jgi:probable rRNA maturation factor